MSSHRVALLAFVISLFGFGCGHSEAEWQAQLDQYNQLKAADEAKLTAEMQKIAGLTKELSDMGVQVSATKADLANRQRALEEFKARAHQLEVIKARFEKLKSKLEELTKLGLTVNVRHNRMVISLPGDVLFDSGRDTLKREGQDILQKVASVVRGDPELLKRDYQVAGHTDSEALRGGAFKDNWGLSLMRAREVLEFLVDPAQGALPVAHWNAAGFADTDPVADNSTPDGRQKNRRCELIVLPSVEEMLDLKTITQQQ